MIDSLTVKVWTLEELTPCPTGRSRTPKDVKVWQIDH